MHPGYEPLMRALGDYHRGDREAVVIVWRDDGFAEPLPAAHFFRTPDAFSQLEREALALCRGRVLDAAALAGANALALQSEGRKVCGLAASAENAAILASRGLLDSRAGAVEDLAGRYDTILNANAGFGLAADDEALARYLGACRKVVAEGGQLLLYARDPGRTDRPIYQLYSLLNRNAGRPAGEVRVQFEYQGGRGAPLCWVHFETERLEALAAAGGWRFSVAAEDGRGDYVARLAPE